MKKSYFVLNEFVDKVNLDKLLDITILEHNQACIQEVIHPVMSELPKHIDVKYQLIFDHVRKETVKICNIETKNMAADVMTKAWRAPKFNYQIKPLGME